MGHAPRGGSASINKSTIQEIDCINLDGNDDNYERIRLIYTRIIICLHCHDTPI